MKYEQGGRAPLVVEDRGPGIDSDTRWRAYLKGRTMGGYLNGFGQTWEYAINDLEQRYERELQAIREGRQDFGKVLKSSRAKRPRP
ncbi:MAG: hypothetical protein ACRD3I_05560 [Terriglobales bacterium]